MNYRFLTFAKKDRFTGAYELTELRIDWDHKAQSDIVACPQEKLELLPLQSRSPD